MNSAFYKIANVIHKKPGQKPRTVKKYENITRHKQQLYIIITGTKCNDLIANVNHHYT